MRTIFTYIFLISLCFTAYSQNARGRAKLAMIKSQLKQIGTSVATYFSDGVATKIIAWKKMEVEEELMTYENPETKENEKILIIEGYTYEGASDYLLAVTEGTIFGSHWATFEDGHVESVTPDEFKKLAGELGLISKAIKNIKVDEKVKTQIDKLVVELGAKKYKARKAAKKALLDMGPNILSHLKTFENHKDFETKTSIKELITALNVPQRQEKRSRFRGHNHNHNHRNIRRVIDINELDLIEDIIIK
jgi:hypothetical protein